MEHEEKPIPPGMGTPAPENIDKPADKKQGEGK